MLRVFIPLEANRPDSGFAELPAQVFQGREAFAELERVSSPSAVVEFNPADPHPAHGDDVIPPHAFYARSLLMNANRQVLTAEPLCGIEFGGDWHSCQEIASESARLYSLPAPSAQWAEEYCRRFGANYLAVGQMDPVWGDASGWAHTLPAVASESGFPRCEVFGRNGSALVGSDVSVVGAGAAEWVVLLPDVAEGGIGEEEGEQIVVAVLEFLALHFRRLAALDENELRMPTGQIFDHPEALLRGELGEALVG